MSQTFGSSLKQSLYGFTGSFAPSNVNTPVPAISINQTSSRKSSKSMVSPKKHSSKTNKNVARPYKSTRKKSMDMSPKSVSGKNARRVSIAKTPYTSADRIRRRSLLLGSTLYANGSETTSVPTENITPSKSKMPKNFYPPESFINFLYRITELEAKNVTRFSLCILDIDNLRGHIQSPLKKSSPNKHKKKKNDMQPPSKYHRLPIIDMNEEKETTSTSPSPLPPKKVDHETDSEYEDDDEPLRSAPHHGHTKSLIVDHQSMNRESRPVSEDEKDGNIDDEDESLVDYDRSDSPLSTNNNNTHIADEAKYIDDQDLQSSHSHRESVPKDMDHESKTVAERTAIINHSRRTSSLLMQQSIHKQQMFEESESDGSDTVVRVLNESDDEQKNVVDKKVVVRRTKSRNVMIEGDRSGHVLEVGHNNFDPYLLFWNNSKRGESVVKVVQDVVLMSISSSINMTHFGFGEFALLGNVNQETEMRILVKKVLNKVSANVSTVKLGPVTLCAGICMYNSGISVSQWVNRCRQACRMAKNNGRGRVFHYISQDKRQQLANEMILEIKKPMADFSAHRVLQFIKEGADVNFQLNHETPLMIAIKAKNPQAIRFLIQYDYNPNIQDRRGKTALILALEEKCDAIVMDMLVSKRDLNPRLKDREQNTALSIALKDGYREIAKTLILLGAEPILGEKMILKQWFTAAKKGDIPTIESMLDGMSFPVDMIDFQDMTALMHACKHGHLPLTKVLLQRGCNINIQGYRGYTALMFACESGKAHIFHYLLQTCMMMDVSEQMANRNMDNDDHMGQPLLIGLVADDQTTILMCAARGGLPAVIQVAIEYGTVEVNARDIFGNTALMVACKYDSQMVAIELLRHYSDLDLQNKKQQNSLMLCCMSGASRIASMLITLGSAIDVQDADGKTALMYAAQNGYLAIIVNLLKYGADTTETLDCHGLNAAQLAEKFEQHEISAMIRSGQLQDNEDILEKMEIYKKKSESLEKTVQRLQQMNQQLSADINRAELQKNEMTMKTSGALGKMTSSFGSGWGLSKFGRSRANTHHSRVTPTPQPPGKNMKL